MKNINPLYDLDQSNSSLSINLIKKKQPSFPAVSQTHATLLPASH
jgi:hypothetical protein